MTSLDCERHFQTTHGFGVPKTMSCSIRAVTPKCLQTRFRPLSRDVVPCLSGQVTACSEDHLRPASRWWLRWPSNFRGIDLPAWRPSITRHFSPCACQSTPRIVQWDPACWHQTNPSLKTNLLLIQSVRQTQWKDLTFCLGHYP